MPPAIARTSLIRLEIAAGLSYRELTPLGHSRLSLARQRPHIHRGVCVCVCVCVRACVCVTYVLSTVYIPHFISDPKFLRLSVPFCNPDISRLQSLTCYMPTTVNPLFLIPNVVPSRPPRRAPLDLDTPGRKKCHHRSIYQLWLLPNARPFVARAVEEQSVRPHYC